MNTGFFKIVCLSFLVLPLLFFGAQEASGLTVPALSGHINDTASLLSNRAVQDLERMLSEFEHTDSTQIVVLTIGSLEGEDLQEFSLKVAENWKIGQKGSDNGAILVIARDEKKIRIEVGRGLEGKLTDLTSGRIIREKIRPRFSKGDFDGGVKEGLSSMIDAVRGEFKASKSGTYRSQGSGIPTILTLLVFLLILLVFLGAISKIVGALAGMIGLPVAAAFAFSGISLPVLGGLGILGLVIGLLVNALFSGGRNSTGRGGGPFWPGGFGGGPFFGGSSGSDSGGGFSGGGGDFGGGGASGDWD
jgi:uncharacterized protein